MYTPPSAEGLSAILFPPRTTESDDVPPVTGIRLGHFIIEERIGRGGMGAVFRAIDQRLNRVVAIKVLTPQHSQDPAAVQRFQNEARAAAQLDHDHIARVHYVGEDRGLHFIAFEFVSGTNIRDLILQRGRLSPPEAISYTLQIAEALRHTSAKNVVHRDIKPSNIIVSSIGRVKLVDLGLARQLRSESRESEDLTLAGTALGTFDYISPEQAIDARNVDVRSDIYSLGCTLFHMLTGEPPYPRGSMFEKVMNHHRPTPPDPSQKNPLVTASLSRVIRKMMASNPDERYSSPDALIVDLAAVGREFGLAPVPVDNYVWSPQPKAAAAGWQWDGSKVWLGLVVLLLLAALLLERAPWLAATPLFSSLMPAENLGELPDIGAESGQSSTPLSKLAPSVPTLLTDLNPAPPEPLPAPRTGQDGILAALSSLPRLIEPGSLPFPAEAPPVAPASVATDPPAVAMQPAGTSPAEALNSPVTSVLNIDLAPPGNGEPLASTLRPGVGLTPSVSATIPPRPAAPAPFALIKADGSRQEFPTLFAACANAEDNAVIELQYEGRAAGPQEPIRITGKHGLRIRPAGNSRPLLEFRLNSAGGGSSLNPSVRMLSLVNSSLEIYDLDLEIRTTAQAVVDHWALFALSGRSDLSLKGCSCTLSNPSQLPAAVIELPPRESADLTQMMKDQLLAPAFNIRCEDTVIRGQGDLLFQRHCHPSTIILQNTAVGLSERMLRLDGADVVSMPTLDDASEIVDLRLEHVSAVLGKGLIQASSGSFGRLPRIQVEARDSLFSVMQADSPLVSLNGHEVLDQLAERFIWIARREPNFFELAGPMWLIDAPQSPDLETQRRFDFASWTAHWGDTSDLLVRSGLFRNPRLGPAANLDRIVSSDFVLRSGDVTPNPALNSTSDRRDAGVDWSLTRIPRDLPVPLR